MARLTEVVKLPSGNVFYPDNFPKELTIQNMTVDEEAFIYGSTGEKAIDQIVKACVLETEEQGFVQSYLISDDRHYLLTKIRILTYGPEYPITAICGQCGAFDYKVDLTTVPIDTITSKEDVVRTIKLPQSGDEILTKIPNGAEKDEIDKENKRSIARFNRNPGKAAYITGIISSIDKINGEELFFNEMYQHISELSGMDSSFLKKELNKISIGYDTDIQVECPKCQKGIKLRLPMTADFFRTQFND